jgi:hypothetical protein
MENEAKYVTVKTGLTFKTFIIMLTLNVIVSASFIYFYDQKFAVKIKAFDMRGYMVDQKKQFFSGKVTEEELFKSLDRVDEILSQESKNTLILSRDAVLRNAQFIKP